MFSCPPVRVSSAVRVDELRISPWSFRPPRRRCVVAAPRAPPVAVVSPWRQFARVPLKVELSGCGPFGWPLIGPCPSNGRGRRRSADPDVVDEARIWKSCGGPGWLAWSAVEQIEPRTVEPRTGRDDRRCRGFRFQAPSGGSPGCSRHRRRPVCLPKHSTRKRPRAWPWGSRRDPRSSSRDVERLVPALPGEPSELHDRRGWPSARRFELRGPGGRQIPRPGSGWERRSWL